MRLHPLHADCVKGNVYANGHWICFDFETTNRDYGDALAADNRVVCVSWLEKGGTVQSYYGNPLECKEFWAALERADFAIAQNAKFECKWLHHRLGFDHTQLLWADTMLLEWVLLGNNPDGLSLSLDAQCTRHGFRRKERFVAALMSGGVCPSIIPRKLLVARCERDVETTAQLFEKQLAMLQERKQVPVAVTRCLFMAVLAVIECTGIVLDGERVLAEHAAYTAKYAELKQRMNVLTGGIENERSSNAMIPFIYGVCPAGTSDEEAKKIRAKSLKFEEIKDRRGKPKRGKPSKSWPDGRPMLNKRVLEDLERAAKTKRQKEWVELRKEIGQAYAAISKNLDFFKGIVLERDCKFYAEIMQGVAATHRTVGRGKPVAFECFDGEVKSTQPQNMPREFKSLQTVRDPDYFASDADGKQIEFRTAAHVGNDQVALANIRSPDFDAHLQTLTVMLNGTFDGKLYKSLLERYRAGDDEVKKQRADNRMCKSHTYKPLFGGEFGTPREEAYYKYFRERYSGVTNVCKGWLKQVEDSAAQHGGLGTLRTDTGLEFYFHVTYGKSYGGKPPQAKNAKNGKLLKPAVFNYPIQQLAGAEIVPIAVVHLYYRIVKQGIRAFITNTVHDSVCAEVHKDERERWQEAVTAAFTHDTYRYLRVAYGIDFRAPLGVEVSWGKHLGEGEHFSIDVENRSNVKVH